MTFAAARRYPEGTAGRGPQRYYFSVHPERLRGFVDLVTHPAITGLCAQVLGPDYAFMELGDVPCLGPPTSRGTGTSPRRSPPLSTVGSPRWPST